MGEARGFRWQGTVIPRLLAPLAALSLLSLGPAAGCKGDGSSGRESPGASQGERESSGTAATAARTADRDAEKATEKTSPIVGIDNQSFRDLIAGRVRKVAERSIAGADSKSAGKNTGKSGADDSPGDLACDGVLATEDRWNITVSAYRKGHLVGTEPSADPAEAKRPVEDESPPEQGKAGQPKADPGDTGPMSGIGRAEGKVLCRVLDQATRRALEGVKTSAADLAATRFAVEFPARSYALIEWAGRGLELDHGVVPVRTLNKELLAERIAQGKEYLFRVIDDQRGGVHKYYYASTDSFEDLLHTIYTSSTLFTLLKLYAFDGDKRTLAYIDKGAEYILSMQIRDPTQPKILGAFPYTLDLVTGKPRERYVVGTASKTIFTLLELYKFKKDDRFMEAALLAADWLLKMHGRDGRVKPYLRRNDRGALVYSKKESMLYTGQVLSALSRVYGATKKGQYLDGADLIARHILDIIRERGCYLGDDYRKPNPISSSWAILALFDFFIATGDAAAEKAVFRCADELLQKQINNPRDAYRHGRWRGSLSSSGNGWLNEVMSELYLHCRDRKMGDCDKYKQAIINVTRLLMQYTYSPENSFVVADPPKALGGVFWNVHDRYVRTDSVCHAMNAYINIYGDLGPGPLVELPEPPLEQRLAR